MFSKNNDKKSMKEEHGSTPNVNMISNGTTIEGAVTTNNDIRIAGTLDGQLATEGKLIVSKGGLITGDVKAKEADIAGSIDGEVMVNEKLILRRSASVKGDITTKSLLVEEGATFDGSCTMTSGAVTSKNGKSTSEDAAKSKSQSSMNLKKEVASN